MNLSISSTELIKFLPKKNKKQEKMKHPERFEPFGVYFLSKMVDKPSSVVYGHLSTNNVAVIPQRYLLNRFGETP